jgi:hypothetical protein
MWKSLIWFKYHSKYIDMFNDVDDDFYPIGTDSWQLSHFRRFHISISRTYKKYPFMWLDSQ